MNKLIIFAIILLILILATIFIIIKTMTGQPILNKYSFTKAICDNTNSCQDYEINCENGELAEMNPIQGAVVQFDADWTDPRDEEIKNELC